LNAKKVVNHFHAGDFVDNIFDHVPHSMIENFSVERDLAFVDFHKDHAGIDERMCSQSFSDLRVNAMVDCGALVHDVPAPASLRAITNPNSGNVHAFPHVSTGLKIFVENRK
jgi:hypothetical protein